MLGLPWLWPDYALHGFISSVVLYYFGSNLAAPVWSSLKREESKPRRIEIKVA